MKKILFTSDCHTGHRSGLIPPKYYGGSRKWVRRQAAKWEWFEDVLKNWGPFHAHIDMGDIIDGMGVKDSTETIFSVNDQISASVEICDVIGAPVNWFLHGTRVHTTTREGVEVDLEVAKLVNTPNNPMISGQLWIGFDKWVLDCRHAPASKSFVPSSRGNPLMKERIANLGWFEKGLQPLATHIIRGHVHQNFNVGEPNCWQAYSCPSLQSPSTKYGRILSNIVDTGIAMMSIPKKGWPIWKVMEQPLEKEEVFKLFPAKN